MLYFFPDSLDMISPGFDLEAESWPEGRRRYHDDLFAHEIFPTPPYDGVLVSRAQVDDPAGRYTKELRELIKRDGARSLFRLDRTPATRRLQTMGDCGAFAHQDSPRAAYGVEDTVAFYDACQFDLGISPDVVIRDYLPDLDQDLFGWDAVPAPLRDRRELTLSLAEAFFQSVRRERCRFTPLGVAQGWSPGSYAKSVAALQAVGFRYIALGGMVPMQTAHILSVLARVHPVRRPETRLHLLGLARLEAVRRFRDLGVASFDSTKPLRMATWEDKEHYLSPEGGTFTAIKIPQFGGSSESVVPEAALVGAGTEPIDLDAARRHFEMVARLAVDAWSRWPGAAAIALGAVGCLDRLRGGDPETLRPHYEATLEARPWEACGCAVCAAPGGHEVFLFRGQERHKRRAFHNLAAWNELFQRTLDGAPPPSLACRAAPGSIRPSPPIVTPVPSEGQEEEEEDIRYTDDLDYDREAPWWTRPTTYVRAASGVGWLLAEVRVSGDRCAVLRTHLLCDGAPAWRCGWEYSFGETVRQPRLLELLESAWSDTAGAAADEEEVPEGSDPEATHVRVERVVYREATALTLSGPAPTVHVEEIVVEIEARFGLPRWFRPGSGRITDPATVGRLEAAWTRREATPALPRCASSSSAPARSRRPSPAADSSPWPTSRPAPTCSPRASTPSPA